MQGSENLSFPGKVRTSLEHRPASSSAIPFKTNSVAGEVWGASLRIEKSASASEQIPPLIAVERV